MPGKVLAGEDGRRVAAEPLRDDRLVDGAEVGLDDAGCRSWSGAPTSASLAADAAPDGGAHQHHRAAGAVVGAGASFASTRRPNSREHAGHDVLLDAAGRQVGLERGERAREHASAADPAPSTWSPWVSKLPQSIVTMRVPRPAASSVAASCRRLDRTSSAGSPPPGGVAERLPSRFDMSTVRPQVARERAERLVGRGGRRGGQLADVRRRVVDARARRRRRGSARRRGRSARRPGAFGERICFDRSVSSEIACSGLSVEP